MEGLGDNLDSEQPPHLSEASGEAFPGRPEGPQRCSTPWLHEGSGKSGCFEGARRLGAFQR